MSKKLLSDVFSYLTGERKESTGHSCFSTEGKQSQDRLRTGFSQKQGNLIPPASEASREVANLTEKKSTYVP